MPAGHRSPWSWVPPLYFAQGLPNVVVVTLTVIMYKRLGISNTDIALYTSWLHLPWIIKPLWSPLVDLFKTKRWWIVTMQLLIGGGLAGVALVLPGPDAIRYSLAFMWLLAFSSATHDIAADGFYMLALSERKQALFIGWRNTFYRIAMLTGQGLIVMLAGWAEKHLSGQLPEEIAVPRAWSWVFWGVAALFGVLSLYHRHILPRPADDRPTGSSGSLHDFLQVFIAFFKKKGIGAALTLILLYRLAEAQLVKMASPFLLDTPEAGGLHLGTVECGFIYGTVGLIALTLGGILGGIAIARRGLRYWIWPMALAMNLPNLAYLYLAWARPGSPATIGCCVAIEQAGYGFGFTALTFFMMCFSQGKHQTAHYAICTGFMALGLMLPGMASGWIQEHIGYPSFFAWVMLCTLPAFWAVRRIRRLL